MASYPRTLSSPSSVALLLGLALGLGLALSGCKSTEEPEGTFRSYERRYPYDALWECMLEALQDTGFAPPERADKTEGIIESGFRERSRDAMTRRRFAQRIRIRIRPNGAGDGCLVAIAASDFAREESDTHWFFERANADLERSIWTRFEAAIERRY